MDTRQRILFIINPISGGTSKHLIETAIESTMDSSRFDWRIKYTSYSGHAAVMATMAVENGMDAVVAVGGDGTINEIARSLVNSRTALGIIPCGSGNGLARHLHIPLEYRKAVGLINEYQVKAIDYGRINGLPFFCTCGMGFDAYISAKFDSSMKRGPLSYVENAVREILNYKPETYLLEDENGNVSEHKAFLITCANASQYGNNAYIAPKASMDDGVLDVTIIEPFNFVEAPILAIQFLNGTLPNKGNVKMFQTRKLKIQRQGEGYLHRDGDPFWGAREITLEAIPQQLHVIINQRANIKPLPFIQALSIVFRNKMYSNTILGQTIANSSREILEKLGL
ncbi:MAG: diacylglycerol kinase family lipid kinase [Bacteroidaceae bacterium]|nr:diacylglycerol kinase family lipid kinase [Bacteroidaceae bacterium]